LTLGGLRVSNVLMGGRTAKVSSTIEYWSSSAELCPFWSSEAFSSGVDSTPAGAGNRYVEKTTLVFDMMMDVRNTFE
jgi:hypothetical protein